MILYEAFKKRSLFGIANAKISARPKDTRNNVADCRKAAEALCIYNHGLQKQVEVDILLCQYRAALWKKGHELAWIGSFFSKW